MAIELYQQQDYVRAIDEKQQKAYFSPFRRDYARVIHSASFRRLQGKTQIYPCFESDFFRNRLTHSLEVAQVAKSIATGLNQRFSLNIDTDLVETAALCHDIGHPPFGHNGEKALHAKMSEYGGFEGNAQTLRLLAKTEKKIFQGDPPIAAGKDNRCGLNLTYRTLAAVIKYDRIIPQEINQSPEHPIRGYYATEKELVGQIKKYVLAGYPPKSHENKPFKTIECYIMDLADDIAYSTYDIEDAFKAGFLDPLSMVNTDDAMLKKVQHNASQRGICLAVDEIKTILQSIFHDMIDFSADFSDIYQRSKKLANSSYLRTAFTSNLVHYYISNIQFSLDEDCPVLSSVYLPETVRKQVEILKSLVYFSVINLPKMNIVRYRGREILSTLFDILILSEPQNSLLPEDIGKILYAYPVDDRYHCTRIISDFIASMTDRYVVELYSRFKSDMPQTIFKPV